MAISGPQTFQTSRNAEVYGAVLHLLAGKIEQEQKLLKDQPDLLDAAVLPLLACTAAIVQHYPLSGQVSLRPDRVAAWETEWDRWLQAHRESMSPASYQSTEKASRALCQYLKDLEFPPALSFESLCAGERGPKAISDVIQMLSERVDQEFGFLKKPPFPAEMGFLGWLEAILVQFQAFPTIARATDVKSKVESWYERYFDWFERVQRRIPAAHRDAMRDHAQSRFDELRSLTT